MASLDNFYGDFYVSIIENKVFNIVKIIIIKGI